MATIMCRCGTYISNSDGNPSPYRAELLPQMHSEQWDAAQLAQLQALIAAVQAGQSARDFVGGSPYPNVVDALLTWHVVGNVLYDFSREVFQCKVCGRLFVETSQRNHFRTFLPETDDTLGILDT